MLFLDTHLVVWLYAGEIKRISRTAAELIEKNELCISPIVELEVQYLFEIGRITEKPTKIILALRKEIGLRISNSSFGKVAEASCKEDWTRDPFDRLIVADARVNKARLLSKDERIRKNYEKAVW